MKVQESGWSVKDLTRDQKSKKLVFSWQQKLLDLDHFLPVRRKVPRRKVQLNKVWRFSTVTYSA
jgi:hypothetical protein